MASIRQYLSQTELAQYANITITNSTEADDQISQAEEMIDAYVGYQDKFVPDNAQIFGLAQSGSTTQAQLEAGRHTGTFQQDYFVGCYFEIVGGTGAGQRTIITGSTLAGLVTFNAITTAADATSLYKIYQVGKFPRASDVYYDGLHVPNRYYRSIPEAVKRATAAQVEFMINQGTKYFGSDAAYMDQEHIGDYMYKRNNTSPASHLLIAPKAKEYLRGITNRKGTMLIGNEAM